MNSRAFLMTVSSAALVLSLNAATYTSASYAQRDHLIAQWDAIDNGGLGTHDPNAAVWKNLASTGSTYDMTLTNSACWKNGDRLVVNGCSAVSKNSMHGYKTIEVVFRMTMTPGATNGRILFASGDNDIRQLIVFDYGDNITKGYFSGKKDTTHRCVNWHNEADNLRSLRSMAGVFTDVNATATAVYGDGVQRATTVKNDFWPGYVMMIGARQSSSGTAEYPWYGEVSTIRIYDCELTAEEIAQNHAIDVARFGEQLPASSDYVQDGLIVQWDGIDNAGTGVHDPNATTWKNLAGGGYDLTLTNSATWNTEGRALVVNGVSAVADGVAPEYKTIEVVCKRTSAGGRIMFNSGLKTRFVLFDAVETVNQRAYFSGDTADNQSTVTKYVYQPYCASEILFLAGRYDDNGIVTDVFKDANQREDGARGNNWGVGTGITIGGRLNTANPYLWYGEVYAIRLYNRRLTKAELARNHRIDCKRFLTSSSYVQEGLTAHWDGTDNVGRGQHDSSAMTWKNLVSGGLDLTIGSGVWTDSALMSVGSTTMAATGTNYQAYNTLEVVYMNANHDAASMLFSAGLNNRVLVLAKNRVQWRNNWATTNFTQYTVGRYSLTGILSEGNEAAYANGAKIQYGAYSDTWGPGQSYVQIGGRIQSGSNYAFTGDIFAIRTYSSTFTPEKVAYNYKVDRRRFGLDAQAFTWNANAAGDGLFTNKTWTAWKQATANVPGASDAVVLPAGDYTVTLGDETVVESLSVGAGAKLKMTLPFGADATNMVPLTVFGAVAADSGAGIVLDAKAFGRKHAEQSITLIECEKDSTAALQALAANISFVNTDRHGTVAVVDGNKLVYTAPVKSGFMLIIR